MTRRKREQLAKRALTAAQWKRGYCEQLLRHLAADYRPPGPAGIGAADCHSASVPAAGVRLSTPTFSPLPIQPRRPLRGLRDHPRYAGQVLLVTLEDCRRDFKLARAYVEWLMANANRWFDDRTCSFDLLWRCIRLALGVSFSPDGLRNCICNLPARTARIIQAAGRRLSEWPFRNGHSPGLTAWIALWQQQLVASYVSPTLERWPVVPKNAVPARAAQLGWASARPSVAEGFQPAA